MKNLKLVIFALLVFAPASYLVADCIGNTTHSCTEIELVVVEWPDTTTTFGDSWCCTPVGDGSDYSCSNGQQWKLSSNINGCNPNPL